MLAAWWPIGTFWQSDDWIALHYAADPARALRDFAGNQYSLPGLVWFYRPLITLSFALDHLLAGAAPFWAHLSNALAHSLAAVLLGLLTARFLGASAGWFAALLWGLSPIHAGSVVWAVGRVDSHCVPWILLTAWWITRWLDGRTRSRAPALLAGAAALATKELAMVIPGIVGLLGWALAPAGQRLRQALRTAWPFCVLLGVYLLLRQVLLGRALGGYSGESHDVLTLVQGLGRWALHAGNPLLAMTPAGWSRLSLPAPWFEWRWLGLLPAVVAILHLIVTRRITVLLWLAALFVGCALPMFQFWPHEYPQTLRYLTLPSVAVAVLWARHWIWALAALLIALPAWAQARLDWHDAGISARRTHGLLAREAQDLPPGTLFVAGLPRQTAAQILLFHLGVDRLLQPPFGDGRHLLLALRPLSARPDATRLPYGDTRGLPLGTTLAMVGDTGVLRLDPEPVRRVEVRLEGVKSLTPEVLTEINAGRTDPAFVVAAPRAAQYRVTVFTASGYLTTVMPDEAGPADTEGKITLRAWLQAQHASGAFIAADLRVPVTLDLHTRFPVLVEAGQQESGEFTVTSVAKDWVWLEVERSYVVFMTP